MCVRASVCVCVIITMLRNPLNRICTQMFFRKSETTNAVNNPETVTDRDKGSNNNRINNNGNQTVNQNVVNNNVVENSVTVEDSTATSTIKDSTATSTLR